MHCRLLLAGLLALAVAPATALGADRTIEIDPSAPSKTWDGVAAPGLNVTFFEGETTELAECGKDVQTYCDDTLVHFTGEGPYGTSALTFTIDGYEHSDYDLRVYTSDATGAEGDYIGNPTGDGSGPFGAFLPTFVGDGETVSTGFADPDSYYLVRVVYFTTPSHEAYSGTVSWEGGAPTEEDELEDF